MAVTITEAIARINGLSSEDLIEYELYVDAANEWVALHTTDTTTAMARVATLTLLDHLWSQSQRGPMPGPNLSADETVQVHGVGYAIPNQVKEMLGLGTPTPQASFPKAADYPDSIERPFVSTVIW